MVLKSTCAFLCIFFSSSLFFSAEIESAFFCQKCVFFSVEPHILSGKYHYIEGFGHKEVNILSKFIIL